MNAPFYLLDTDICSYLIKGRGQAIEAKLASIPPDRVGISAVTRAELLYGLKSLASTHRLHFVVHEFLQIIRLLPWGAGAANYYAGIRHQLTTSGQPIGEIDMMIAAQAMDTEAVLVTNNIRHFKRIECPLQLENWLAG
jgi:tRNA(fMet)-specific endonuclease VapC